MQHKIWTMVLVTLSAVFIAGNAQAGPLDDISGVWLTEAKTAHVDIVDCGDGTPCGSIIWVDSVQDTDMPLDINNKDKTLAKRPLVGIKMIYGFKPKKNGWKKGKIYNPGDGKTYGSAIKLQDNGTLQVKGCVGPLCQTQIWTRVEAESQG